MVSERGEQKAGAQDGRIGDGNVEGIQASFWSEPLQMKRLETMPRQAISDALRLIFSGIQKLIDAFPHRSFTIDGRLVGDVGEVIAALEYDIVLHERIQPNPDATTSDGRNVQIKATFKNSLTFRTVPDYYLGFKLYPDGSHEEIFNGPGRMIYDRYAKRKGIGSTLLSFPVSELRRISDLVPESERIRRRRP